MWSMISYLRMIIVYGMEGARYVKGEGIHSTLSIFINLEMHFSVHDKAKNDHFETLFLKSIVHCITLRRHNLFRTQEYYC
jgi:hypothetical protein